MLTNLTRKMWVQFLGNKIDHWLGKHGRVIAGNGVEFDSAAGQIFPAQLEIEVGADWPLARLEQNDPSGIRLRFVTTERGMHNGIGVAQPLLAGVVGGETPRHALN